MTFAELTEYHKAHAAEELTFVTIIITVTLGVISFIGSTKKLHLIARILMSIVVIGFYWYFTSALMTSIQIHSAIHLETVAYLKAEENIFPDKKNSILRNRLIDSFACDHPDLENCEELSKKTSRVRLTGIFLAFGTIYVILFVGEGSLAALFLRRSNQKEKSS